jgi:putative flippase GtrA
MKNMPRRLIKIDFVRFCMVGSLGFVINAVLLTVLNKDLNSPFAAQMIASEVALLSSFMFHHHWTYRANKVRKTMTTLIIQFHATSWVAIVGSAVIVATGVDVLHLQPVAALAISSAVVLFWNFAWSKYVIWRGREVGQEITVHADEEEK